MKQIQQTYVVRQKELKKSKNEKPYLKLELVRQNDRVFGLYWKEPESVYHAIHFEDILEINGSEDTLNNRKIITIQEIKHVNESINILELQDLFSVEFADKYILVLSQLNETCRDIVKQIYDNKRLYRLANYPAGKLMTYHKQGGLWLKMTQLFNIINNLKQEKLNISLIKTAILLQAVAFTDGLSVASSIEYKTENKLVGLGNFALLKTADFIDKSQLGVSEKSHLKHLILMMPHYNKKLFNVPAMTKEAYCLKTLNRLVNHLNFLDNLENKAENQNRKWSTFNKMLNTQIYFPDKTIQKGES